jgi:Tfp pilus assembly protein PilN
MKKIAIDFAPRSPWRSICRINAWTALALLLGLALCSATGVLGQHTLATIDTDSAALQGINQKLNERDTNKPAPKKIAVGDAQASAVNTAIAQLNLPWGDVFDAVEAATPKNVALLALEPDAKRDVVKGVAEAKTSDDMIAYIEQLKKQNFFQTVLLTKHEINEQDPNKPLRFQFEAQWTGATP